MPASAIAFLSFYPSLARHYIFDSHIFKPSSVLLGAHLPSLALGLRLFKTLYKLKFRINLKNYDVHASGKAIINIKERRVERRHFYSVLEGELKVNIRVIANYFSIAKIDENCSKFLPSDIFFLEIILTAAWTVH